MIDLIDESIQPMYSISMWLLALTFIFNSTILAIMMIFCVGYATIAFMIVLIYDIIFYYLNNK